MQSAKYFCYGILAMSGFDMLFYVITDRLGYTHIMQYFCLGLGLLVGFIVGWRETHHTQKETRYE